MERERERQRQGKRRAANRPSTPSTRGLSLVEHLVRPMSVEHCTLRRMRTIPASLLRRRSGDARAPLRRRLWCAAPAPLGRRSGVARATPVRRRRTARGAARATLCRHSVDAPPMLGRRPRVAPPPGAVRRRRARAMRGVGHERHRHPTRARAQAAEDAAAAQPCVSRCARRIHVVGPHLRRWPTIRNEFVCRASTLQAVWAYPSASRDIDLGDTVHCKAVAWLPHTPLRTQGCSRSRLQQIGGCRGAPFLNMDLQ